MANENVQNGELGSNLMSIWADLPNRAAPNAPYYTPVQHPPAGTALDPESAAVLFKPLQIRGLKLQNRIFVRAIPFLKCPHMNKLDLTPPSALTTVSIFRRRRARNRLAAHSHRRHRPTRSRLDLRGIYIGNANRTFDPPTLRIMERFPDSAMETCGRLLSQSGSKSHDPVWPRRAEGLDCRAVACGQ